MDTSHPAEGARDRASDAAGTLRATLLGSGGWIPTTSRETCCLYLRKGSDILFLDAGTGLRHAVEQPELLAGARSVQILLSHFHLDHVVGLAYLPALPLPAAVTLWGPGRALYGEPTATILRRLLGPPFFTPGLDALVGDVLDLAEGANACGSFTVRTRRQVRHSEPTLSFRIDDKVAYCTDTAFDEENAELAAGCTVLFHDAWTAESDPRADGHTSAVQAGLIAQQAGVDRLVLVHVHPLTQGAPLETAARATFAAASIGHDLLSVELG